LVKSPRKQDAAADDGAAFGPAWLSARTFRFEAQGQVMAPTVRFSPNGFISGYSHFNEAGWRIVDGQLVILRQDGAASCVLSPRTADDGAITLIGPYLFAPDTEHRFHTVEPEPGRADVFSFDLFDTLVARRCFDPLAIFRAVETKSGTANFARHRQAVEAQLWKAGDYDLNDIYAALGQSTGWPQGVLDLLRALELVEEWDNLFPIAPMVARVRPNDVIISDMYLPDGFLRRLVDQTLGLPGRLLHVSSHGKHRGEVWARLKATHRVLRHHGDNAEADVRSPIKAGIEAEHVTLAAWTAGEAALLRAGLAPQAYAIREARLRYNARDLDHANAARVQFELNLPLLVLASADVLTHARETGADALLLCARDGHLWARLMRVFAPRWRPMPTVRYILASRALMLTGGAGYERYFGQATGRRNLVVDVSGTGRSLAHFIAESGRQATTVAYLVAQSDDVTPEMDAVAPARPDVGVRALTSGVDREARLTVEAFNMPLEGSTLRLDAIDDGFEAHARPSEFGPRSAAFVLAMSHVFDAGVAALVAHAPTLPSNAPTEALQAAAAELMALAPGFGWLARPLRDDLERADASVVAMAQAQRVQTEPEDDAAEIGEIRT
jgi:hypothetical protein